MPLNISLAKLNFQFTQKPLLIGGMAMQYYGLRQVGADIDLVICAADHARLWRQYPENRKELWGDLGICVDEFEIWDSICLFDYEALSPDAVKEGDILVISLEKLLFLKALALRVPKYQRDLELVVECITRRQYETHYQQKMALQPSPRYFVGKWQLDPAQSAYQSGTPPLSRTYTIEYDGHQLHFTIESMTADGQEARQQVDAIPNGIDHPYENPAVADTICYRLIDQWTLESTVKKQGKVVACARRVLSQDRSTMTITQSGYTSDGTHFDNVSVYRRL